MTRRKRMLDDLEQDIRDHIARETQDNIDRGMTPEEARYAAMRKFGNVTNVKEETRDVWSLIWLEQLLEDIRFGLRLLRKNPGFTAVAVLTLALGIGANAAVFSVVYAVLLRPLPYQDPSGLIVLHETTPKVGEVSVSFPNFIDWRAASHTFAQMAAVESVDFNLAGITQPENISGDAVSPNFLSMMGVRPFLGRDFDASEEKAGTAPVLLLSYSLWQSHLGGDPNAVGKTITLDGRSFTIVGVLPPNYRALDTTDVLLPIGVWATKNADAIKERGDRGDMVVIGRLGPGVAFGQARAEMEGIAARLAREYPGSNDQFSVTLHPIREAFVGDMKTAILILFGAVLFVLLIACANVANLFLVRGASRTKEIALRIAFGASRGRIIRQMLTESFILACFGGAVGVALAFGGIRRNGAADSCGHVVWRHRESKQRGPAVRGRRGNSGRFYFRPGARPAFDQARCPIGIERRRTHLERGRGTKPASRRAGRRGDLTGADSSHRRGIDDEEPLPPAASRSRVSARSRADDGNGFARAAVFARSGRSEFLAAVDRSRERFAWSSNRGGWNRDSADRQS